MRQPQYTFTGSEDFDIQQVDDLAKSAGRSRSEMIVILLMLAIKEKHRKRKNAKEVPS